jgi:hypothetical protein
VITMAGAPLMINPKDMGIANGLQFTIRGVMQSLASECPVQNFLSSHTLTIATASIYTTIVSITLDAELNVY